MRHDVVMDATAAPHRPPSADLEAGGWCLLGEPLTAARVAAAGFDWVCLDQQHGAFDDGALLSTMTALTAVAPHVPVAVRLASADAALIGRALDVGASIVIVPLIESAAQAEAVVAASYYPPRGRRSWGPLSGIWGAASPTAADAGERTRPWAMIETAAALADVETIAAVPGLDGIFVGPFDLALALGLELDDLLGASPVLPRIVAAASAAGLRAGAFAGTAERAARLRQLGFTTIAVATDQGIIADGAALALGRRGDARAAY